MGAVWAGGTDPSTLANLKFKIAEGADLTEASTSIRLRSSSQAIGYNFYGKDLTLGVNNTSEDFSRLITERLIFEDIVILTPPAEEPVTEEPVSEPPEEPYQEVYFDNTGLSEVTGNVGEEFTLPLMYKSSDGSTTTGLGVNVYYDSSLLTLVAVDDQLSAMVASNTFGQDLADETNKDSDDSTDKYVNLVWGDFMGSWAGGTDPYTLANLKFKVAEGADLTEASTSIRIEESETAIGYNFYGQDLNLGEESEPEPEAELEPSQVVYFDTSELQPLQGSPGEEFTL